MDFVPSKARMPRVINGGGSSPLTPQKPPCAASSLSSVPHRRRDPQAEFRRNQPSPLPSQPSCTDATGRGRDRPTRGKAHISSFSLTHALPSLFALAPTITSLSAPTIVAASNSLPPPPSLVLVSTEALSLEVEQKLALQLSPSPSSSKA